MKDQPKEREREKSQISNIYHFQSMLLRARMEDLEKVKEADRDLTLQTKYHLPSSESPTPSHKVCLKGLYDNFTLLYFI